MLNRTVAPSLQPIEKIHFVDPEVIPIKDNTEIFWMNKVADETVRIELHFHAGHIHGKKNMAEFVSALLLSGTKSKTSFQIHEELDELGVYIDQEISLENAYVSLFCLRKNALKAFEILVDAIQYCNFQEQEILDMLQEKKQRFLVSVKKVNYLARRAFEKYLFNESQNYSRQVELADFEKLDRKDLMEFHQKHYLQGLAKAVVVGNLDDAFISVLKTKIFSMAAPDETQKYEKTFSNQRGEFHIPKTGALQTAIRIGKPLFNKKHPDYFIFQVLQTILGDYFGSRLMTNIREDKGYTYGIGCSLVELKETGYFVIATEVAQEVTQDTIREIKIELERLKEELVEEEELELVKNYLLGQLLKNADGPNAMMDLFLGVEQQQMNLDFYNTFIEKLRKINSQEINEMAINYFDWSSFTVVTAGEHN